MDIVRRIELDAGHRLPEHQSKCRHLHGHRYAVEAAFRLSGADELVKSGPETGMVADFGWLKDVMMRVIHDPSDHKMILSIADTDALDLFVEAADRSAIDAAVARDGYYMGAHRLGTALYIIAPHPTVENLALHWGARLRAELDKPGVTLSAITVYETPNCKAVIRYEEA